MNSEGLSGVGGFSLVFGTVGADGVRGEGLALVSNRTIAMAIGIVMARRSLTDDAAQQWLAEVSQRRNTKMRTLAEQIVFTGSVDL